MKLHHDLGMVSIFILDYFGGGFSFYFVSYNRDWKEIKIEQDKVTPSKGLHW